MKRNYFRILTLLWIVFITTLSLVSFNSNSFKTFQNSDKIVHFIFYFVLALLLLSSFNNKVKHKHLIIIVLSIFYGIIIELLQEKYTLTRKADVYDVIANTIGVICAFLLNKNFTKINSLVKIKKD